MSFSETVMNFMRQVDFVSFHEWEKSLTFYHKEKTKGGRDSISFANSWIPTQEGNSEAHCVSIVGGK